MKTRTPLARDYYAAFLVTGVVLLFIAGVTLWQLWDNTHAVSQPIIVKSELSREEFNILKPDIVRR